MIANVIGLGSTWNMWPGTGFSIGVNDIFSRVKTNNLVVVNSFKQYPERLEIIEQSRPEVLWSNMSCWKTHPNYQQLKIQSWGGILSPGKVYYSNNSPFIAATLAYSLGYRKIILWGVDFNDHKIIAKGTGMYLKAIRDFKSLQNVLLKNGASLYLGCEGSALDLEVWK